jgi:hypothetical protein
MLRVNERMDQILIMLLCSVRLRFVHNSIDAGPELRSQGRSQNVWGLEGDATEALDETKVQAALQKLREESKGCGERYNGLAGEAVGVAAEDMEAYRRFRTRAADPMGKMQRADIGKSVDGFEIV